MPDLFRRNGRAASAPKSPNGSPNGCWPGRGADLLISLSIALLCCTPAFAQRGAHAAQAGLDTLVHRSATIVRGSVVSAVVEPHPQFPNIQTVVVTFTVTKVLKGSAAANYTFRQVVLDSRDAENGAGYRKAGQLLLLLNPVSEYGLTSTVGLEQGRFQVQRDAKGKFLAVNGRGNIGLFQDVAERATSHGVSFSPKTLAMLRQASGRVSLDALEEAITALAGANQ